MAKVKITDYSATAALNTDLGGIGITGAGSVTNGNDAFQTMMKHLAETNAGTYPVDDTWSFADPANKTKKFRFDGGSVTAGQTRVITIPDEDMTIGRGGKPLVILATGQSNIALRRAHTWTPEKNLFLWPWFGQSHDDDYIASAFIPMSSEPFMASAYSFANEVAKNNPSRTVYLFNIGWGNMPIRHWMVGAAEPDMWTAITNNVAAGLSKIGVTQIDHLLWWQGETDAIEGSRTYPYDFETVMTRLGTQTWFRNTTPTVIMGFSPVANNDLVRRFDDTLKQVAARSPETRTFVSLAEMRPTSLWVPGESNIHLTAEGYEIAGRRAYTAFATGANSGFNYAASTKVFKHSPESRSSTTTLADDLELKCYLRVNRSYIIKARIQCAVTATGDLKWGFTGPTANRVDHRVTSVHTDGTTATMAASGGWPTNKTALGGFAGMVWLDVDLFVHIVAADGIVNFQWSQNTIDAAPMFVFNGSHLEVMEVPYPG